MKTILRKKFCPGCRLIASVFTTIAGFGGRVENLDSTDPYVILSNKFLMCNQTWKHIRELGNGFISTIRISRALREQVFTVGLVGGRP